MAQLGDGVGPEPSTCLLPSRARAEHPPAAFPRTRPSTGLLPSHARACCLRVPGLSTSLLRCVAGPSDRLLPWYLRVAGLSDRLLRVRAERALDTALACVVHASQRDPVGHMHVARSPRSVHIMHRSRRACLRLCMRT